MTGGQKVKLTLNGSNKVVHGTLKYANDDLYIVEDSFTGEESIFPSRSYTIEKF